METETELRQEVKELRNYVLTVCDRVPDGLGLLRAVLQSTALDLGFYLKFRFKNKTFDKSYEYARAMTKFTDFDSPEFDKWLLGE